MAGPITFGRYVLLDKLALGGMAEIFLAKAVGEAGFEKTLVIKRVLPHLTQTPGFVEMFLDEARIAAQLSHPGIVQIFDLGKEDEDYYFAMEYLAGEDVSAILRRSEETGRPVPVDVAVKIAAAAAEALHYAHEFRSTEGRPMGIVHRDVSPSNLFVTYHGTVKVLDFGVARAEQRLQQTRAGHVKGKAAYMSPEQARGAMVDRRTDVWALGVCLHEMLCGRRLFLRETSSETLTAVRDAVIPHPRTLRQEIPPDLDQLVMAALERDPNRRVPDADALRAGLESYLANRTYVPQTVQLGLFLRDLFGTSRADQQLRRALLSTRKPAEGTLDLAGDGEVSDEAATQLVASSVRQAALSEITSDGRGTREQARTRSATVNERVPIDDGVADENPPTQPALGVVDPPSTVITDLPHETLTVGTVQPGTFFTRHPFLAGVSLAAAVFAVVLAGWLALSSPPPDMAPPDAPRLVEQALPPPPQVKPAIAVAAAQDDAEVPAPQPAKPDAAAVPEPQAPSKPQVAVAREAKAPSPAPAKKTASRVRERRAPPKPAVGRLSLRANAPATAFVGGQKLGELPLEGVTLAEGTHRLKISNPALGISTTARIQIEGGKNTEHVLTFKKGKLNVIVDPWADVFVNGSRLGQTPLAGRELYEGRHRVRLVGPSSEKTVEVEIQPGRTAVLKEQLP